MNKDITMPLVYIIILNWNGYANTIECLESIYNFIYRNFEVVVVDNGSTDGSLEKIKEWAIKKSVKIKAEIFLTDGQPDKIKKLDQPFIPGTLSLIETNKNLGFSGGNNRGIKYALLNGADYIFLLNNDTVIMKDTLSKLLASIKTDKRIGAVFPKVLSPDGELQVPVEVRPPINFWELLLKSNFLSFLGKRFKYREVLKRKSPYKDYQYDKLMFLPTIVMGALYRRNFFEEIGLLDENVFMYYEEYILLKKAENTNFIFCFNPFAELIHKVGEDTRKLPTPFLYIECSRSEIYYGRNYLGLSMWQQYVLKILHSTYYIYCMTRSRMYRKYFRDFIKRYLFWDCPAPNV